MIYAAVTDIVCPTVTTEDPLALLAEEVFLLNDFLSVSCVDISECSNESVCSSAVLSTILVCIEPLLAFSSTLAAFCHDSFYLSLQSFTNCLLSEEHTITELSVVFEQGVVPSRALAFRSYCVRCGR